MLSHARSLQRTHPHSSLFMLVVRVVFVSLKMVEPSGIVALDCEMVGVGPFGAESGSAHCSIVDYYSNVLYNRFIRPEGMITDYSTFATRVCPSDMQGAHSLLSCP